MDSGGFTLEEEGDFCVKAEEADSVDWKRLRV